MGKTKKNRFTLKIIGSYVLLILLSATVGYFVYAELNTYFKEQTRTDNDLKLLRTGSLLTGLYEAENLSKLALQTKTRDNFRQYEAKIDSLILEVETLKQQTGHDRQILLLDSIGVLLKERVANNNELRNLKLRSDSNNSLDEALQDFRRLEATLGKITPEALAPNFKELSPKAQEVIEDIADYLNENVPENDRESLNRKQLDSVIVASKALITEAKRNESRSQQMLRNKEEELLRNDLALSQQLKSIVSAVEEEVLLNSLFDTRQREEALRRSFRIAVIATALGLGIVILFTFMIHRDYWQVQNYRRQLEKQKGITESLLRSREQLISTVSHDLRTPLNAISGYSELLEATGLEGKQKSYLEHLQSASAYVDRLVNDLLDFSRLASGKLKVEMVPFSLAAIIRETAENVEKTHTNKKGLRLEMEIAPDLKKPVVSDPFRIRQILYNLIGNAFKFTHQGTILIRARCLEKKGGNLITAIEVIDTGIGIPKQKQDLIFQEFQQGDERVEKTYGGYGLGLTISKKLAELLGGSLGVKSKAGKGSTFTLQIPLKVAEDSQGSEDVQASRQELSSLLLIDDDTSMLQLLEEMCRNHGLHTIALSNFETLDPAAALDYQVVLTDIQMPGTDGFEVLRRLQSGEFSHYHNQPIIAMTGRRDMEPSSYRDTGFAAVLKKPFRKEQLLAQLHKMFPASHLDPGPEERSDTTAPTALYSLETLRSFLGDDDAACAAIMETFVEETKRQLKVLSAAVKEMDIERINQIAHRMLPMFRQLQARRCVPDLEELELLGQDDLSGEELEQKYKRLENNIRALLLAQEDFLRQPTGPGHNG